MISKEQERAIVEQAKVGDESAFRQLIYWHKDEAFSLACSILKDRTLAEDVLQEVFIKVFQKIDSFNYQSRFYTWLYRIVVNRCYNERRKKKQTLETLEREISGNEGFDNLDLNDINAIMQSSLDLMKPNEALVLRLFYLSELSIEEVKEVTGFSQSKVKVALHRGRKNLKELLLQKLGKEIEDL